MKISQKQIQIMYQVLVDSLCIVGSGSPFKFDRDTRRKHADEILNQQSNVLLGVDEQESCEHENDGTCLLSNPVTYKCTKCGEFYK